MLKKLYLHNFRNYEEKRLDFSSPKVLLCGVNGIGKTNILEAIHYLGILRSFKNAPVREIVRNSCDSFILMAQFEKNGTDSRIHIEQAKNGERSCFLDGVPEKRANVLLHSFRSVIFAPEDRLLVSGTAAVRRRFFDIMISLDDNVYLSDLQQYKHALAQRNALLKKSNVPAAVFAPFEELMAFHGIRIMQRRALYCQILQDEVNKLAGNDLFRIHYAPDWKYEDMQHIQQSLRDCRSRDMQKTFTTEGVQLDEFEFQLNGFAMRSYASSGQTRIYSLYLKMAEFNLSCAKGDAPTALVDDVTGELDEANKNKFYQMLERAEQSFFTFTEKRHIFPDQQIISL